MIFLLLEYYLPIFASVLTVISAFVTLIGPLTSMRKKAKRDIAELFVEDQDVQQNNDYPQGAINISYRRLKQFYEITRNQNNLWLIFSVILFIVGIIVIIVSLMLPPYTHLEVTIVVQASGALLDIIGIAFFLHIRQANQEIDRYCNAKFLESENLSQLIKLISDNPNPESRNRLIEKVTLQILVPMREGENLVKDQAVY